LASEKSYKGKQWRWDITLHHLGVQRLVENQRDGVNGFSDGFSLWNSQLTHSFSNKFEIYLGGENIGDYRQVNPIIGSDDPFGVDFDAAQVYAPVFGAMIYTGLRLKI
jgi:outer membrane receptor for ferrienterochelin and colicins